MIWEEMTWHGQDGTVAEVHLNKEKTLIKKKYSGMAYIKG